MHECPQHVLQKNFMKNSSFLLINTSDGFVLMSRDYGCLDVFLKIVFSGVRTTALRDGIKDIDIHVGTSAF